MDKKKGHICPSQKNFKKNKKMSSDDKKSPLTVKGVSSAFDFDCPKGYNS